MRLSSIQSQPWRTLAYLPAKLYELGVVGRNALYETGYRMPRSLRGAVVSVGNITVGGTGKTPLVEYLARYLTEQCYKTAILSRGYRGKRVADVMIVSDGNHLLASATEAGDEAFMLAKYLPGVVVAVGSDRLQLGRMVEEKFEIDVHLLDDGFQHRGLARDLNLLLLDSSDPFGGGKMVPFGRLREPLVGMRRADAIIVTRSHLNADYGSITAAVQAGCGDVPVIFVASILSALRDMKTGEAFPADHLQSGVAGAFCGIGNPQQYFVDLEEQAGVVLKWRRAFPDHHAYSPADLELIQREAHAAGCEALITTEKDAVRLGSIALGALPIYVAQSDIVTDDEIQFKSVVLRAVAAKARRKRSPQPTGM